MGKIYNKFVEWLCAIPFDKYLHYIAGLLIALFFGVSLGMGAAAFIPALFAGFIKEFVDEWKRVQAWDWWDFAATTFGGLSVTLAFVIKLLIG